MGKKQTAVEWLGLYIKGITTLNCDDIIEQAKEMEKQQIIDASAIAYEDMFGANGNEYGENYYNKNYKI